MSKYEKKAAPIRSLINHPDVNVLANTLTKGVEGIHGVAPNIAQSLQTTGTRALQYLHSQMPKPANELIGDSEYEPSKSQQRTWLGLHDVVNDPVSVLDHVRHGTLTKDHMDALSQVHPELLDDMRQKVMAEMDPKKVKKLPTSTKAALGTFLGSPVTEAHMPQSIMANQLAFQAQMAPMAQGKQKSTVGGMKELKVGERSASQTTELEEQPV